MRFSIRWLVLFVTGAALLTFAGTLSSHLLVTTSALLLMVVAALVGRQRYWVSMMLAAFSGALGFWLALLFHAFILPWNYLSDAPQPPASREAYQKFVRETFVLQSAFLAIEGFVLGVIVATLLWGFTKLINRFRGVPS